MFLKQIELIGFKSFAEPTELTFMPGITAVVGPNGSGKSNISDAIRWVLGEQSARTLRGGKMEDVIFSGSDSRQAVNYCEVSLTLDNTESTLNLPYSEVTVTRRLYRSGESEYFINRQACRLKDIIELFIDTGLGRDAFTIIGQGQIDEILSTKAEDRRGIFENAAGISKYKQRKREAERKLAETEQNLTRLSDLINELKEQVEPLARQREIALSYQKLSEQLKQVEIGLLVRRIDRLHQEWNVSSKQLQQLEQDKLEAETQLKQREAIVEKFEWELLQLEEQLQNVQTQLITVSATVEKTDGQRNVLVERIHNQQEEYERLKEQLSETSTQISQTTEALKELKRQIQEKEQEIVTTEETLLSQQQQLHSQGSEATGKVEEIKAELIECLSETASLQNELRHLKSQEQEYENRQQDLNAAKRDLTARKADCESQLEQLHEKKAAVKSQLTEISTSVRKVKEQQETSASQLQRQSHNLHVLEQKLQNMISRRDVIKELEASYAGFYQGVKEILKAKRQGKVNGVAGAVLELINVPAHLEVAIETALGGALQHIVVSNEQAGRACIAYLKKHRLGRATFLPLDVIRPRQIEADKRDGLIKQAGFVGVAIDLVECDDTYRDVLANLLGQVIIAKNLDNANEIARYLNYRYRIVTIDGDVVNPGGAMTGGTRGKQVGNVLGRKRELEQLSREITELETQQQKLVTAIQSDKQGLKSIEKQLEQLRSESEALKIDEQKINGYIEQKLAEQRTLCEQLSMLEKDEKHVIQLKEQVAHMIEDVNSRLNHFRTLEENLNNELRELEHIIQKQEREREQASSHITNLKVSIARYKQEHEHLQENKVRYETQLKQLEAQATELKQRLTTLEENIIANEQEKQELEVAVKQLAQEKSELEEKIVQVQRARATKQHAFKEAEGIYRNTQSQLRQLEEAYRKQEVNVNRLDVQLTNVLNTLSEQYEISYELAKARYPTPEDEELAENRVTELKLKIQQLGQVNLGAIDEYKRVCERLSFLEQQQDDLLEAKASLYEVIQNIESEMSRRFQETFHAVREQFERVFIELFGGGRADLQLSEPDSILETGIDIVVQPPGKKLQQLSLLSGGERTLTAIALLFAILHVRPVPFCVLDEVEAALDEANVVRFAHYLKRFSDETQFIVITHRKGTMEEADVLYGVTMQESGVSTLVSVKMEDDRLRSQREIAATRE